VTRSRNCSPRSNGYSTKCWRAQKSPYPLSHRSTSARRTVNMLRTVTITDRVSLRRGTRLRPRPQRLPPRSSSTSSSPTNPECAEYLLQVLSQAYSHRIGRKIPRLDSVRLLGCTLLTHSLSVSRIPLWRCTCAVYRTSCIRQLEAAAWAVCRVRRRRISTLLGCKERQGARDRHGGGKKDVAVDICQYGR
jgi:hypothetical protein